MSRLLEIVKTVRKNLTDAEIHSLFVSRLDDEMFAQIGAAALNIPEQRRIQKKEMPHLLVWRGYEELRKVPRLR